MIPRRATVTLALCTPLVATATTSADPVPVIAVSIGTRTPSGDRIEAAERTVDAGARPDATALRALGDAPVTGDTLASVRSEIALAIRGYYASGAGRDLQRRLSAAVHAMDSHPLDLSDLEANRHSYGRALLYLARIALETHQVATADALLRRSVETDPLVTLDPREYPPDLLRRRALAASAVARLPHGSLTVRVSRPSCELSIDGRNVTSAAMTNVSVLAGTHRVSAVCNAVAGRIHTVDIVAGGAAEVSIDPDLDAAIDLSHGLGLRLAVGADDATVRRLASGVARALGASRAVIVTDTSMRTVDATGTSVETVALAETSSTPASADVSVTAPAPAAGLDTPTASRSLVGPGVLMTVGGIGLAAAAVFYGLRMDALSSAAAACPMQSGMDVCPVGTAPSVVTAAHDNTVRATTMTEAAIVGLGVGVAAGTLGVLWLALGHAHHRPVTGFVHPEGGGMTGGIEGAF